jgi:hypothetical protein
MHLRLKRNFQVMTRAEWRELLSVNTSPIGTSISNAAVGKV